MGPVFHCVQRLTGAYSSLNDEGPVPNNESCSCLHRSMFTVIMENKMNLVYEVIEDVYDDTTQIRSMTEQAQMPSGDWLIRTTVYTPHHISMNVISVEGKKDKKSLFKTV